MRGKSNEEETEGEGVWVSNDTRPCIMTISEWSAAPISSPLSLGTAANESSSAREEGAARVGKFNS